MGNHLGKIISKSIAMQKSAFFFFLLFIFAACKKDDCANSNPGCIDNIIQTQSDNLLAVKRIDGGDEYHYWLNPGDNPFDRPEHNANESCHTVCVFCFCPPDPCLDAYQSGEWEIIWQQ